MSLNYSFHKKRVVAFKSPQAIDKYPPLSFLQRRMSLSLFED